MPRVLVLAPRSFGSQAQAFVDAAVAEVQDVAPVEGFVVDDPSSDAPLGRLREGDVVLGSISSDLALQVSALCAARGLVHVESGAVSDDLLGTGTVRLTPGVRELARAVHSLVREHLPALLVVERSAFGAAVERALRAILGDGAVAVDVDDILATGVSEWVHRAGARSLIAALRPPYPEQLCAALVHAAEPATIVGTGSWTRPEVGVVAAPLGDRLRIVDLLPGSLLVPSSLAPELRPHLAVHLEGPRSLYRDMGWAAGLFLARHVLPKGGSDVRAALFAVDLSARDAAFGHGVRFAPDGDNLRARRSVLAWRDGSLVRAGGDGDR